MSRNGGIGDAKILQRRIPSTAKYTSVSARVDTGSSITKHLKRIEDIQTNYRYKKDELFKRMKATTLAQLVLQVANISMQDEASEADLASARSMASSVTLIDEMNDHTSNRSTSPGGSTLKNGFDGEEEKSPRSSLQSVIRGMGEVDMVDSTRPKPIRPETPYLQRPYTDCPYLLLDVRDSDDFNACHIVGAKNFPIAMLSRTMNNFSREILDYKNSPGRIIILYDEDERLSTVCATTMVERGFDNIFILSGGLKILAQNIPEGIVTGAYPASCPAPRAKPRRSKVLKSPLYSGPPADMRKHRFSAEDLDKISHYLDESLVPQDTGSRLSRQTNNSTRQSSVASKASSTTSSMVGGRRAWR
uniref:Centrosomal protein of 41 kDa n=1 Tax=Phallusia mammillata TaxID=59560 RepID=A0A6F9DWE4_9ASCI|nr:centrosomal protein of 41 kDa [Phallusia mammillata]